MSKHAGHINTRFVYRYVEISFTLFFRQGALSANDGSIFYEANLHVRVFQYLLFIRSKRLVIFAIDIEGLHLILSILYSQ